MNLVEVQNITRSQAHKSKKDSAHGNEKRKKAWPLKIKTGKSSLSEEENKPWALDKEG